MRSVFCGLVTVLLIGCGGGEAPKGPKLEGGTPKGMGPATPGTGKGAPTPRAS